MDVVNNFSTLVLILLVGAAIGIYVMYKYSAFQARRKKEKVQKMVNKARRIISK